MTSFYVILPKNKREQHHYTTIEKNFGYKKRTERTIFMKFIQKVVFKEEANHGNIGCQNLISGYTD